MIKVGSAISILMLLSFGCTSGNKDIKIGVYAPLTGPVAPLGETMKNGVEMAIDEINASGGILGKKVTLAIRNDEANNDKGPVVLQELLDQEKVAAVLGPVNTGVADASSKYSNMRKIPHIITSSVGAKVNELFQETKDNYVFRTAASDLIQTQVIVSEAVRVRSYKKLAILCDETPYGKNGHQKLDAALEKHGLKPVYFGEFKIKQTDMSKILLEAKSAGAEALLVYGVAPELAAIVNTMDKIKWKVDVIGGWGLSMATFIEKAGKNGEGASMVLTFIEASPTSAKGRKFIEDYHKKYQVNSIASAASAAQGYDAAYLLKAAMEQAGTTEGSKVKEALENLEKPYEGLMGTFVKPYSSTDHEAIRPQHVQVGIIKNGVIVSTRHSIQ